jgi:pilus assembly protein CpaF
MFTIIISEKGGAERRESFDKNEINVGRVQGNDLMLPKGNVSKHHARLLYRDGRFIVTDLKSTNGTYVNGRKISQATIVREGDKIYIGDFVLRLETQAATAEGAGYPAQDDSQGRTPARAAPIPREAAPPQMQPMPMPMQHAQTSPPPVPPQPPMVGGPMGQMGQPMGAQPMQMQPQMGPPPMGAVAQAQPMQHQMMASPLPVRTPDQQSVSHYPLERDPDESESAPEMAGAAVPKVPGPPRVPQPQQAERPQARDRTDRPEAPAQHQQAKPRMATAVLGADRGPAVPSRSAAPPAAAQPVPVRAMSIAPRALPRESPQQAARRLALITLVDRVADVVDLAPLKRAAAVEDGLAQQVDRAVREQAKAMRDEGEAPEGTDLETLARDAVRELVGLGPLGPLLEEEETTEVHVSRPDYVLVVKGTQLSLADTAFTSEDALARVVARLAAQSGDPVRDGELVIERRLTRGAHMIAVAPPAASSWVLAVRKRRRVEGSLEDFTRGGAVSRAMATFLDACLQAHANVLVVGSGPGAIGASLGALTSAVASGERVVVLQDSDEISIAQAQVISLALPDHGARGEEAVRAAARLGGDRLVVGSLAGSVAAATVDAIAEGAEGVLAGVAAPTLRHALARIVSQVALARGGAPIDAAREAVGESFDVALEVVRAPDGRTRVLRIAELAGADGKAVLARDLFVMAGEGQGDAAFVATGITPRLTNDFASRGIKLDPAIFKRAK